MKLSKQGRSARLAFTAAESAVGRSLSEPTTKRVDGEESRSVIAGLRRLIRAAHSLRTELGHELSPTAKSAVGIFAADVDQSLTLIAAGLDQDQIHRTASSFASPLRRGTSRHGPG